MESSPWVPLHPRTALVLVFLSFIGVWIAVQSGFANLDFGSAHQVLNKRSEPVCLMHRARVSSSQSSPAGPPHRLCNPPGICVFAYKFGGMICPHLLIQVLLYP